MDATATEVDAVHRYWKVHEGLLTRMAETSFINEGVVSLEHGVETSACANRCPGHL